MMFKSDISDKFYFTYCFFLVAQSCFVRIYLDLCVIFDLFACFNYIEYYTRPKKAEGKSKYFTKKLNFEMINIPKPRLHSAPLHLLLVKTKTSNP